MTFLRFCGRRSIVDCLRVVCRVLRHDLWWNVNAKSWRLCHPIGGTSKACSQRPLNRFPSEQNFLNSMASVSLREMISMTMAHLSATTASSSMKKRSRHSPRNFRRHRSPCAALSPSRIASAHSHRLQPRRCSRSPVAVSKCRRSRSCRWPKVCTSRATSPTCERTPPISLAQLSLQRKRKSPSGTVLRRLNKSHEPGARRLRTRKKRTKLFAPLAIDSVDPKKFVMKLLLVNFVFTRSFGNALLLHR
ncbi:unannotated protein [freshwater metagenome]|uniref:Unannotated protein n=1 Tax=freshwater metagenome TaxID=449393 RepID=A0A6J7N5Z9_9ZZZZ